MTTIHVCPLSKVPAYVATCRPGWSVSLLGLTYPMPDLSSIAPHRRLHVAVSDVVTPTANHVLAAESHMRDLLGFLRGWDREAPLLIHCYAGVSRSTAAAFVALCLLDPDKAEDEHARHLRDLSPTATPNRHIIALADSILGRGGRMVEAVAAIGRGAECFEGVAFSLDLGASSRVNRVLDASGRNPA